MRFRQFLFLFYRFFLHILRKICNMTALHPIIKKTYFSNKNDQGRNFMPKAKFNDIYKDLKKKIEAHAYPY